MDKNTCNICKIRAYIQCDQCDKPLYFCSRGHLHSHKIKIHSQMVRSNSNSVINSNNSNQEASIINRNQINREEKDNQTQQVDLRKLFEYIQKLKSDVELKMKNKNYIEGIFVINKCLSMAKKFYQEDHLFNIEMLFKLAECYVEISNLEEAINNLENILFLTQNIKRTNSINIFRYKSNMLIGATSLNIGDYSKALKAYNLAEQEIYDTFVEPDLNLKLASIYLNIGICYIYLNNPNNAEKYLRKGITQTEGMLGNDIVYKLNSDLNENLGIIYEQTLKGKEALNHYKKSLKTKFGLYGENHDEVLDLQYKISCIYITMKQFKEAEAIMIAMSDVILKEKLLNPSPNNFYRYGVYFYTTAICLIKNNKNILAKEYLNKSKLMWKDNLNSSDPALISLNTLLKICDKKN